MTTDHKPFHTDSLGIRLPVTIGLVVIMLFFGVLGLWSALAPLQSAAIAQGVLAVDSQRKTIQHLEGGIVEEIRVREGQRVSAGEVLVELDETQALARLDLLNGRLDAARAQEYRLRAERDGLDAIAFPTALTDRADNPDMSDIINGQQNIFAARRQSLDGQEAILERRIEQYGEEIKGLNGLFAAQEEQSRLTEDEIASNQVLVDQGLSGKSRLLELQRDLAQLLGSRSQNQAALARSRQNIDEARLQISDLKLNNLNEVVQELREVQTQIVDLNEQIRAAQDVLQRTVIRAAQDGTIVNLQIHTPGGVIAPGQTLMDIVPAGDAIIVEARINPVDIDIVEAGLSAHVRLTAYSSRNLQPVEGRVITVSADRLTDPYSGNPFYLARIEITGDLDSGIELYPGMQAEVMVVTGARTLVDFLTLPIRESFNRALREE
jgi:HlyD family type I secretion membrane fusion protein